MAPTAAGAWLLARNPGRRAPRRTLTLPTLTRRLDALPLALLPQAQARRDWLDDIGCHTLADLRALPRAGPAAAQRARNCSRPWTPPTASARTPPRIEPPHQFRGASSLRTTSNTPTRCWRWPDGWPNNWAGWLAARQLAVRRVVLSLEHERGRHARPPAEVELALAQPVWQAPQPPPALRKSWPATR